MTVFATDPPTDAKAKATWQRLQQWRQLAARHGVSLLALAIAVAALPRCVSKVVLGMGTVGEVEANLDAASEAVPAALWREAVAAGLLPQKLAVAGA